MILRIVFPAVAVALFAGFFIYAKTSDPISPSSSPQENKAAAFTPKENTTDSLPALPDSLANEDTVLVAWKHLYRLRIYHNGRPEKTYVIGLGQEPIGHKQMQGDNRTPEGDYRIIQKSRGPFEGDYAQYLGVAWMRLNYPNNADAIAGYQKKLITEAQKNAIVKANNAGKEPPKTTKLGGGIGIHGWWGEWPGNDRQNLTWGCISVQNTELDDLYKRVSVGNRIIVYP